MNTYEIKTAFKIERLLSHLTGAEGESPLHLLARRGSRSGEELLWKRVVERMCEVGRSLSDTYQTLNPLLGASWVWQWTRATTRTKLLWILQ